MTQSAPIPDAPWRAGWESARALFRPGLVLQAAALGLVLAYYWLPATHGFFERLAVWRNSGGYLFSTLATVLCGGVLPFLYLRWDPATRAAHPWSHLWFFVLFWAWKGAEIDVWYRLLGSVIGQGAGVRTVALKVLADQFIYNPFYAAPVGNICFAWKDAGFKWAPVAADLRAGRWYLRSVLPVLMAVWCLWIPVVCCVFALPAALQVPLFNVVLCFWSLLFAYITAHQKRGASPAA